jgi:hypothetical protein
MLVLWGPQGDVAYVEFQSDGKRFMALPGYTEYFDVG